MPKIATKATVDNQAKESGKLARETLDIKIKQLAHLLPKADQSAIYLSGPMSGLPDFNLDVFHIIASRFRAAGYLIRNPAELNLVTDKYELCMRRDITVLAQCGAMLLLPGWNQSKGVAAELVVASVCGIPIYDLMNLKQVKIDQSASFTVDSYDLPEPLPPIVQPKGKRGKGH